jgi:putative heme-binding domain-containing protein
MRLNLWNSRKPCTTARLVSKRNNMRFRITLLFVAVLFTLRALGAGSNWDGPVPTPDAEKALLEIADGYEINLFAADPLIAKPIQMNFDPAGRLWIATSETYPQIKPGSTANDKVLILEDDGTGKARAAKIFVEGLLIPTGVIPGDGGAYVANSTELLHFNEKDGKASDRRIVLSGFGTEDTHHILHTLRWGPDSRLYFNQSVYIHSHIETPWGVRRLAGGGVWRFDPPSGHLEVFVKGLWNCWGHIWDNYGQEFGTDGAGGEGINYFVPGAVYASSPNAVRVLPGLNPGSPKYAGEEIMTGRHLPDDMQGIIVTNDFRASRVCRFKVSDDGSGFSSKQLPDLVKSTNRVFRPIDVKMGPDGAIYIADWCNPIINHGEVDFRDPRRDHSHGRIWRITAKGRPLVAKPKLVNATVAELLEDLKLPEMYTRQQAKRVMAEMGAKLVAPALDAWVLGLKKEDEATEHYRLEALWTYESIDQVQPKLLQELLASADPRVRAAAVRVVSHWHGQLPNTTDLLAVAVADQNARVRLEAIRALAEVPTVKAQELALVALDHPRDKFIDYALWMTTRDLEPQWKPAFDQGTLKLSPAKQVFSLQAIGSREALKPLLDQFRASKMSADERKNLIDLIASSGGPEDLAPVFELAVSKDLATPARLDLLSALNQAARQRKVSPHADLSKLGGLLKDADPVRAAAAHLAGSAKIEALRPALTELAMAKETSDRTRSAAMQALAGLSGRASVDTLAKLSAPAYPRAVRLQAVTAMAQIDPKSAAPHAAELLAAEPAAGEDPTALFNAFIKARAGDSLLAQALKDKKIPTDAAKLGQRAVYQASRLDSPLLPALAAAGNLGADQKELTREQMTSLIAEVASHGDPARGEAVFRRKEMSCLQCHMVAGSGGIVAPDLLSIGASAPVDYIIDSVLYPNKAIKEGYNSTIVTTKSGDQITGIRVRQDAQELVLKDATHDAIVIPMSDIKSQRDGGSIMPSGLTDSLTHGEFVDLIRFLTELGKGKYAAAGGQAVARRWRVLESPLADGEVTPDRFDADSSLTWMPAYSEVNGILPPSAFNTKASTAVVRCEIEATSKGAVTLKINSPDSVQGWIDGNALKLQPQTVLDLTQGVHTLTLAIQNGKHADGLRLELEDIAGSGAKVQFVGGK